MSVPSTPQDLINLIREKLFNNTSGKIDEPSIREVLEWMVKVLDAKFSLFSPELTEEQYSKWNLMLDYMVRETKGVLTTTSPAPTGASAKGKYLLSGAGTYTNLGGLVATADKLNYAYFDGTTWTKIEIDNNIENFIIQNNILQNPKFENDFSNWNKNDNNITTSVTSEILSIDTTNATNSQPSIFQVINSLPAGKYVISLRIKNTNSTTEIIRVGLPDIYKEIILDVNENFQNYFILLDVENDLTNALPLITFGLSKTFEIDYFYFIKNSDEILNGIIDVLASNNEYLRNYKINDSKILTQFSVSNYNSTITVSNSSNSEVIINIGANNFIFDLLGGYRKLEEQNLTISNQKICYLSYSATEYQEVDLSVKGTGQSVYIYAEYYDIPHTVLRKNAIGMNWGGWTTQFSAFEVTYENIPFFLSKNITINYENDVVSITSPTNTYIFDVSGGYRKLVTNIDVNFEEAVYLSSAPDSYVEVDMFKKGTGQNVYLWKERYDADRTKQRNNLIGINYYGWTTQFSAFEVTANNYENIPFFLSKNITINDENDVVSITSPTNTYIFDVSGGYRKLVTNIDVNFEEAVYLSSAPDSYVEVDMFKKGTGQNVYLWKERYDAYRIKQRKNLIGINYYGWSANHPSLEIEKTITSDYKKWFPNKSNIVSPLKSTLKPFIQKYYARTSDVTIVQIGDSISTDLNWTNKRPDANERPPFCTEYNVNSYLEEKLRWKEQKYRRFDYSGVFTEILGGGNSTIKDTDDAWGTVGASFYFPITKVIDGGNNAGVSFKLPANNKRLSLIVHTDYQFAAQTKVVIAEGNGKVEVWNGTAWVEANEFTISFKESNTQIVGTVDTFYKDNAQKRLKFRNVDFAEKTITVQNVGAGRFGYWGIEYSPNDYMFTYICASKGSHSIARLQQYETWMVDEFNPDLVLWQMPILNESFGVTTRGWDSSGFSTQFINKYNALIGKGYLVLPYILWAATYSEFVDTNGNFLSGLANGKIISPFADVANIMSVFTSNDYPVINLFNLITEIAINKAKEENGNIYSSALVGSGKDGNTFTIDGIHMNKLGSDVVFNLLEPYFNF